MQSITAGRSLPEAASFIANVSTYLSNWMTHRGHVTITARKSLCEELLVCSPSQRFAARHCLDRRVRLLRQRAKRCSKCSSARRQGLLSSTSGRDARRSRKIRGTGESAAVFPDERARCRRKDRTFRHSKPGRSCCRARIRRPDRSWKSRSRTTHCAADQDDIEVSFQIYKNGQAQRTPFMPQHDVFDEAGSRRCGS